MLPHADTHSRIEHFASRYHHWAFLSRQGTERDSNGCGGVSGQTRGELLLPAAPSTLPSRLPGRQRLAVVAQAAVLLGRGLYHFDPAWNMANAMQIGSKCHAFVSRCLGDEAASMYPPALLSMSSWLDSHQADPSMSCSACALTSAACTLPMAAALLFVVPLPSPQVQAEWGPKEHREPVAQALGWSWHAFSPLLM